MQAPEHIPEEPDLASALWAVTSNGGSSIDRQGDN
jgi:hypothetical protein